MKRQYFGTDGIRGRANTAPMTADFALRLAQAAGMVLREQAGAGHGRVVIGKDTRLSCYMLEQAMTAGFLSVGFDVLLLGPLPTPAVATLTQSLKADIGVVISASHNPYQDNGIKFFQADGTKLSDAAELAIEKMLAGDIPLAEPDNVGRATRVDDALGRYIESVKASLPRGMRMNGLKIVVDCANGAGYRAAPQVLWELGTDVIAMGVAPNGTNINAECGATHTAALQARVVAEKADLGIALDGDADRLILVDECGKVVDGDQILALVASEWHQRGLLKGGAVVSTLLSNLGFELYMKRLGLTLHRAAVGDRYVAEMMRQKGCNLGGEPSGHIILSDHASTGDGLLAAIQVLAVAKQRGGKLSEIAHVFDVVPQRTANIKIAAGAKPLEDESVKTTIEDVAKSIVLSGGRLVVRPSGTEPLIRIMAEGTDETALDAGIERLKTAICAVAA